MQDFAIRLSDRPGELAQSAMLARYGVNLKSLAALAMDGRATVHILPDEAEPARAALTGPPFPSPKRRSSLCSWKTGLVSWRASAID